MSSLIHTIYEAVDASVSLSSGGSKTLRVKLTVSPESPRRRKESPPTGQGEGLPCSDTPADPVLDGSPSPTPCPTALTAHSPSLCLLVSAPSLPRARCLFGKGECERTSRGMLASLPAREPTRCGMEAELTEDPRGADKRPSAHTR